MVVVWWWWCTQWFQSPDFPIRANTCVGGALLVAVVVVVDLTLPPRTLRLWAASTGPTGAQHSRDTLNTKLFDTTVFICMGTLYLRMDYQDGPPS